MQTNPEKQVTGNRESAYVIFSDEMDEEDPAQGILD